MASMYFMSDRSFFMAPLSLVLNLLCMIFGLSLAGSSAGGLKTDECLRLPHLFLCSFYSMMCR